MDFKTNTIEDIDNIFEFYDMAITYQKTKFNKQQQDFDRTLIKKKLQKTANGKLQLVMKLLAYLP